MSALADSISATTDCPTFMARATAACVRPFALLADLDQLTDESLSADFSVEGIPVLGICVDSSLDGQVKVVHESPSWLIDETHDIGNGRYRQPTGPRVRASHRDVASRARGPTSASSESSSSRATPSPGGSGPSSLLTRRASGSAGRRRAPRPHRCPRSDAAPPSGRPAGR